MCLICFLNYLLPAPPHSTSFGGKVLVVVCVQGDSVGEAGSHCLAAKGNPFRTSVPVVLWAGSWVGGCHPHLLGRATNVPNSLLFGLNNITQQRGWQRCCVLLFGCDNSMFYFQMFIYASHTPLEKALRRSNNIYIH